MMRRQITFSGILLATASCLVQGQIRVPLTGFVVDHKLHVIRAIQGVPGSSVLGDPIDLGMSVQHAWFSPAADLALATDGTQLALVQGLNEGSPATQLVTGAIAGINLVAFNESGTSAVAWSQAAGQIQWIGGLPGSPAAQTPMAISSLPGKISALALDAAGQSAYAASSERDSGGIFQISNPGGSARLIVTAYRPGSLTLANHDQDLLFADTMAGQVVLVEDISGSKTTSVLASATDGVQNPVGLRMAHGTLLIVSAGAQDGSQPANLIEYDLSGRRIVAQQSLPVIPTRLDPLSLRGTFLINDTGPGPLYLFSEATANLSFVPPVAQ